MKKISRHKNILCSDGVPLTNIQTRHENRKFGEFGCI